MSERDPRWYRDAVIHQLHVKSFFDANDDGVGDFAGLLKKLDYVAELGVNTLWLLPFYPSPRRDDGYDIADCRGVHPDYGSLADARRFVKEAHRRRLNVIAELVINHIADQHPWFQRARRAKPGSWERNFYVWSDTDDRYPETRIIFPDTEASDWAWDAVAQAYYWHRFYSHQPDLNFDNPRVLREVLAVMRFWLDAGVDGLKLDAVPYLAEREGSNNEHLPETHAILKRIRAEVERAYPGRMLPMPGTPIIYYGDEIGMGDNIYLGDRDGVRTPMLWSPDRNGGFSRADPARLVLPPIQDPIYGFQAARVQAQSRDPHSLLNWMRRMLAVRARSKAFGRGARRLLYPSNRKVIACLREEGTDTILCVFNLSRAVQAVELDLSALAGRVPAEMLGGTPFPPIGRLTYLLTLPPYAFYWFLLAEEMAMPGWHVKAPGSLPELRTIVIRNDAAELLNPAVRRELEREILPAWLPLRRWFAAKGETPREVRIAAHATLPPHTGGYVALACLREGATLAAAEGETRFLATERFATLELAPEAETRRLSAAQSNSTLIHGAAVVLKLLRRLAPGVHPEAEMTRHLAEAGDEGAPALLGEVVRVGTDGTPCTLMLLRSFVRNQGEGWQWTRDRLARAALTAAWREAASHAFLDAYRAAVAAAPQRIVAPTAEAALLDLFLVQKAAYELRYEAANRPERLPVPLRGLLGLAARIAP